MPQKPNSSLECLMLHVCRSHTHTLTVQYCSQRTISSWQRPLHTQHRTNTTDEHSRHQRDSKPKSQ